MRTAGGDQRYGPEREERAVTNRKEVERLVERWTQDAIVGGRLEAFDDLLAPDVCDRSGPVATSGVETFKVRTAAVRSAFADIELRVEDLVVDDATIAWRWALTGTHVGPFAGIGPTGRRVTLRGVNFQRLEGGRVVEHWTLADLFGATQALRVPS
jgi:predicted ester cyclase